MTKTEAYKLDTEFYAELDEETGDFCVFGDNSGFAYRSCASLPEAEKEADEMNERKRNA